jgi:hypothetical protein
MGAIDLAARKTPAPAPEPLVQLKSLEGGLKESSGSSIWWIMIRWISYNLTRSKYSIHVSFSSFLMFEK